MKKVYAAETGAEAHMVAALLADAGIEPFIEGNLLDGARWGLVADASTLPTVSVADEDFERAVALIRETRSEEAVAARAEHLGETHAAPRRPEDTEWDRPSPWARSAVLVWVLVPVLIAVVGVVAFLFR